MGWAFQGFCYTDETALVDGVNASGLYPAASGQIANAQFYWFNDVAALTGNDGIVSMRVRSWNATNADIRFTFTKAYPYCPVDGPMNTGFLAPEDVPAYASALLPLFVVAYLIRKFRSFLWSQR